MVPVLFFCATASAVDIEGVQPAAMDQPRVHVHLRRERNGKPLAAGKGADTTINIQAFLDTGASGVLLSKTTADGLDVKDVKAANREVEFHDVGVGGADVFHVSEPLFVFIAPFAKNGEPADADGYPLSVGPLRMQLGASAGMMDMLTGGLDVLGMPAIKGHVMVLDPKPVDTFGDTMRAGLLMPGDKRIPKTDHHVALTFTSMAKFTQLDPPTAQGPALAANPFIKSLVVSFNGKQASGTWLLDTGAAASIISKQLAEKVGVTYAEETEHTSSPKLLGPPKTEQFSITIGGIGGTNKAAGFFLDTLTLPTREKDAIVYRKAPVLVADITATDEKTKEWITLDGVLGMNYFVASALVEEGGLIPDVKHMTAGPYEWVVIDEPHGELGVKMKAAQ